VAVPLQQVARIEPVAEEPILWRRNRELMISVRADIRDGVQAPDAGQPAPVTVKAKLESGGTTWFACTLVAATWTCPVGGTVDVLDADELRVVAAQ
jgi:hypothetical protein